MADLPRAKSATGMRPVKIIDAQWQADANKGSVGLVLGSDCRYRRDMEIKITHQKDNPVSGRKPPIRLRRATLTTSAVHALVDLQGHFPNALEVTMTLAGLLLHCPYGSRCPCWIELAPTASGERSGTTYANRILLEQTDSSIKVLFIYRHPLPPPVSDSGDEVLPVSVSEHS